VWGHIIVKPNTNLQTQTIFAIWQNDGHIELESFVKPAHDKWMHVASKQN